MIEPQGTYPSLSLMHVKDEKTLTDVIYPSSIYDLFMTYDWTPTMYDALAYAGFITISTLDDSSRAVLLPELQWSYAVLHWDRLHLSERLGAFVRKRVLGKDFNLSVNRDMDGVLDGIRRHHAGDNWMNSRYMWLLKALYFERNIRRIKVMSVEIRDGERLAAGEIGYLVGSVYTSLSGFFDREHYSNFGTIQLICLSQLLERSGCAFWNMGHPYMPYKFHLGARECARKEFLDLWMQHRDEAPAVALSGKVVPCSELLTEVMERRNIQREGTIEKTTK